MSEKIYLSPPHMSDEGYELEFVKDVFDSNWIAPLGPHVDAFECEFADYIGVKHAAALTSGTGGLHIALKLIGVKSGDEVLCSTFTFAASAFAITYLDAVPVFVDSEPNSWNMDPNLLEAELQRLSLQKKLPKAVIVVDLYGQCADYNAIIEICDRFGVPIIEDAAEALGASYHGKRAGRFGKIGIFSFNGNKIITTSGGGMLVSDDENFVTKTRFLVTQARDPAPHYQHTEIGYNYRMSNVLAAIGRGQLKALDKRIEKRRWINEYYVNALSGLPGVQFMPEPAGHRSNKWLTCITVEPKLFGATREDIRLAFVEQNIEVRPLWKPMHKQPVFEKNRCVGGQVSADLFRDGLCLPSGTALTTEQLERICSIIRSKAKG